MKRMLSGIAVLAVFVCGMASVPAKASETITAPGDSLQKSVTAEYVAAKDENLYSAELENRTASVTTGDGTVVTITVPDGVLPQGTVMFVRQIPPEDEEAYAWISAAMTGLGIDLLPFYIYFENDGERVEPNGKIIVTVTLPASNPNTRVYLISVDGTADLAASNVKEGKVTFEISGAGYYVLANKAEGGKGSPDTGDKSFSGILSLILFMTAILLPSAGRTILVTQKKGRHKV